MIKAFGLGSTATNYQDALKEVRKWLDEQEGVTTSSIKVEGHKTTVTLPDGRVGVARCNPCDKFDIITGIRIALDDIERKSKKLSEKEKMLLNTAVMMGATRFYADDMDVVFLKSNDEQVLCCDKDDMFAFLHRCEEHSIVQILRERG
jgi:hypothetical protein